MTPFSLRLDADLRCWLRARAKLSGRSMNAEIAAMLDALFMRDPLTRIRIIEDKGRFITTSAFTEERFGSYAQKSLAAAAARAALDVPARFRGQGYAGRRASAIRASFTARWLPRRCGGSSSPCRKCRRRPCGRCWMR